MAPERSGAGSASVSQRRALSRRAVPELGLGRGKLHRELSEHLRMRVERVAGRAPRVVGERWPLSGHT